MDEQYLSYVCTEFFCVAYAATMVLRLRQKNHQKPEEKCLRRVIAAYIAVVVTDACSVFVENSRYASLHMVNAILNGVSIAAVALGCLFWLEFVEMRLAPQAARPPWAVRLLRGSAVALCALDLVSSFTGWVFFILPDGRYEEGSLFWVQEAVTSAYLLIPSLHALYRAARTASGDERRECLAYVGYICIGFAAVWLEDRWVKVPIFELGVLLAVQNLFMTLYIEREHQIAQQERELGESRIAIILSQIQPHFLFNALGAIAALCRRDPAQAEQTLLNFSDFLRGNLDSLTADRTIPFERELRHTQNYLAIEQVRFGERLRVEWDIGATLFRLPPLTLQPLVENAVRYGVTKRENGGTVRISTRETPDACEVAVEDDGLGFDPMQIHEDGRSHIGIQNVRERLESMCGGTLTIDSQPGIGTRAVIVIPRAEE